LELESAFLDKRIVQKSMDRLHNMALGKSQDAEEFFAKFDILREEVGYEGAQ
jgi:hypothetical protein